MSQKKRHLIFSDFVNAWSIRHGLRQLGKHVEYVPNSLESTRSNHARLHSGDVLFFTDERGLQQFADRSELRFLPRPGTLVIDDKLWFYDWLAARGEQTIPYGARLESLDIWPVLIKARHSWKDHRKLPRGFVCSNPLEFRQSQQQIHSMGLNESDFCTQKFITSPGFVYSVCGHFDSHDNQQNAILVTRKTMTSVETLGTGTVVDTVDDPADLLARTTGILNALEYCGPFELEFLHDTDTQTYYVLELNPRFWMQHGIFIERFDNILLKRYLGIDAPAGRHTQPIEPVCWMNRVDLLTSLVKCDWRVASRFISLWWQRRRQGIPCLLYPDLWTACGFLMRICRQKFRFRTPPMPAATPDDRDVAAAA
ncbi:MAG: hypothetical protein ABGZ17_28700 [Planctomycetaceae bacterium]